MKRSPHPARLRWKKRMAEGDVRRNGVPAMYKRSVPSIAGQDALGVFRFIPNEPFAITDTDEWAWAMTNDVVDGLTVGGKWIDGRIER